MEKDIVCVKNIIQNHVVIEEDLLTIALYAKKYKRIIFRDKKDMRSHYESIVDVPFCIKMYEDYNVPVYKMAMIYGTSDVTLREYMIKYGVKLKGHKCGRNSHNEYFKNIDSSDKAYFLGLIAADGSVVYSKTGATVSIELIKSDCYILERFNEYGKFEASFINDTRGKKNNKRIVINSRNIADDLNKYGIVQNKSYNDSVFLPKMSEELTWHFIRGYFDGNGIANNHGYIGFCGSKTIIEQIHDYIIKKAHVTNTKITYNKLNHIYYIQWGKIQDTKAISNLMYNDSTDLFLLRKQEKIYKRFRSTLQ